jgi:FAD/FMN-containing dehydrogenase
LATKLLPAAVEVGNGAALENMDLRAELKVSAGPFIVMVALEAFQEAVIRMRKELVVMAEHFKTKGHTHITEDEHRLFWLAVGEIRTTASRRFPSLVALQLNYPLSSWKALFEFADKTLREQGVDRTILSHSGSGVTLINLLLDRRSDGKDKASKAVRTLLAECRKAGGNLLVQSAPAGWKESLPVWGEPGSDLPLMKSIRRQLDPSGLLNPGRFAVGV